MTETATETNQKTWVDWVEVLHASEMSTTVIDREELLRRVSIRGHDITPRTLRYWELLGIVPGPIRRWHDGAVRALYPEWNVTLVSLAAHFKQQKGTSDAEIAAFNHSLLLSLALQHEATRHPDFQSCVQPGIRAMAHDLSSVSNRVIAGAHIAFRDQDGNELFKLFIDTSS